MLRLSPLPPTASAAEMSTKVNGTAPFTTTDVTLTDSTGATTTTNITVDQTATLASVAAAVDAIAGVSASIINNQLVINTDNVNDQVVIEAARQVTFVTNLFGKSTITQLGYDFRRTVRIFDSLGARDINVNFKKQAINQWLVEVRAADETPCAACQSCHWFGGYSLMMATL